ncbi:MULTISPECIES: hypothetical protein [Pseudomonas]|uniref:hypothetical protein n=1 Tax=Pseudomonas TaxID=286 RepID=UPI000FBC465E|nr:hypothetical protein [Pseudomonas putida]MDD1977063.1 hypothetical protein [Pseudomonas putida]
MNRQAVVFAFTGVSLFLPTVLASPLPERSSAIGSPYYQIEGITMAPSQAAKLDSTDGQLMLGIRNAWQKQ